jgi:F0F1-type ATP synthase assembly protein I
MTFSSKKTSSSKLRDKQAWALAASGLQITVIVGVFILAGLGLDAKFNTAPWFLLGGSIVGIGLGLYSFLVPFLKK